MKQSTLSWNSLLLVTFFLAYLFIFNEWLFAVTKPSYMNGMGLAYQLEIYLTTSALLAGLSFLSLMPLLLLSQIPPLKKYTGTLIKLGSLLPAAMGSTLILILVDNFTYTVFKFGIASSESWTRGLYGLGFLLTAVFCYRHTIRSLNRRNQASSFRVKWVLSVLSLVLLLSLAVLASPDPSEALSIPVTGVAEAAQHPHILLVTADGVDATHMSVYGYERDTTPRLLQLAEESLVAENVFPNADHTSSSVMSIYTGKHPTRTRLLFAHNILKGRDAYEHLPGILRSQGYKTVQITIPYYLDPNAMNLLEGFDEVKMSGVIHSKYLKELNKVLPSDKALFIDETSNRVVDRLRHIFFMGNMNNIRFLAQTDTERWETLRQEIRIARQPLFIHIHLVVTHGKRFNPEEQVFSAGRAIASQGYWEDDFYDDSILDFDKNVGKLVDELADQGLLDDTILIIGSDHGQQWDMRKRVPLLIRFPHGEYARRIQANVQNLDIAPTILDYIGLEEPDWMNGSSLLGELEQRPIFAAAGISIDSEEDDYKLSIKQVNAPFGELQLINLVYCQKWYRLDVVQWSWETGDVEGSSSSCPPSAEITDEQAFHWMLEHLRENGYPVSLDDDVLP